MTHIEAGGLAKADSSKPLLSIIIPTYNRQEYAVSAIRCALAILSSDIEIVVQDCSDDDSLSSLIAAERLDKRLSYHYERPAHMSDNWNRAISWATGEYLCLIGDDDGVNPEIVQAAAWARNETLDCLAVRSAANYPWPSTFECSTLYSTFPKKAPDGYLEIVPFRGNITTNVDTEVELTKLMQDGGAYYLRFNLPKLYHGLVHRRCLDAVREKVGTYCGRSMSPDMFLSLAIACTAPHLAVTDYPLTIPGECKASNSIIYSVLKRESTKLEDHPDFRDDGGRWSEVVPRLYTVPPIWADAAVAALLAMGRSDLVQQLNLPRLAAYCVRANRGVTQPVLRGLSTGLRITGKNFTVGVIKFAWILLIITGRNLAGRIKSNLLLMLGAKRIQRVEGVNNMVEVSQALTRYLNENGWSFAQHAIKVTSASDPAH
jgi:glycosyltransferase involved in cell wall biosynthesis